MDQSHPSMPHHGLLLHIRKNIPLTSINFFPGTNFEAIAIITTYHGFTAQIIFLYSSPRSSNTELLHNLQKVIPHNYNFPLFVIGDFNIQTSSGNSNFLTSFMKRKYNLDQYVSQVTTTYLSTIDLVFSNYTHQTTTSIANYWSDHFTLCTAIDTTKFNPH